MRRVLTVRGEVIYTTIMSDAAANKRESACLTASTDFTFFIGCLPVGTCSPAHRLNLSHKPCQCVRHVVEASDALCGYWAVGNAAKGLDSPLPVDH